VQDQTDRNEIARVVAGVRASAKYRHVCDRTIWRIASEEWARRAPSASGSAQALKQAVKATRARLHQVYAAYESHVDYERTYRDLEAAYAQGREAVVRQACRDVLARHASTRERLGIVDRLYSQIWAHTGVPGSVLDLACGLNPLALPWMGLRPSTTYHAYDIDAERIAFLNRYLALAGMRGFAHLQDVISDPPAEAAEVALLMKTSACLERQRAGSTSALLELLQVRHIVVTFPVHSLGLRRKGMPQHYTQTFQEMLAGRPWGVTRLELETELAFIVDKAGGLA
jgi:16S rRNA (guanine(1405)-N(7))-methyltransferase